MTKDVDVYASCDRAIRVLDRQIVEAFGQMKTATWDRVSVIRMVTGVYRELAEKARKRYKKVGWDAYLLGLLMCGIESDRALQMARKVITETWIEDILEKPDIVTFYRFDRETERKAYRLAEALEVTRDRNPEIDKAMRAWSNQVGQYAINVTDYAMVQAYKDAGVEMVMWQSKRDKLVCRECHAYDGQVFHIDEVPPKHWNCRCKLIPMFRA